MSNTSSYCLLTDLYEFTMAAGYLHHGRNKQRVSFDYYFRSLPGKAGFAVFAGLEPFLDSLRHFRFSTEDIEYLRSLGLFDEDFLRYLSDFHPSLDVWAAAEGSVVFPNEPLVRIEGPLIAAQLVETFVLNSLNYPTLIATKAARVVMAAGSDTVLEFGLRRAQGPDGGLCGSRAAYIGGCHGTSNVLAGKRFGIPVRGTHAHSWVMLFDDELSAFRAYAEAFPQNPILLVDTYDTLKSGMPNAIKVFRELREKGYPAAAAVRLDSGDLAELSKQAWRMLKRAGFENPLIVASNELDEFRIAELKKRGAKINAWGVGTHLITSRDSPSLNGVYKLTAVEHNGTWKPRIKVAATEDKNSIPARKSLWRLYRKKHAAADLVSLAGEHFFVDTLPSMFGRSGRRKKQMKNLDFVKPLLKLRMKDGRRTADAESLQDIRARAAKEISTLPAGVRRLSGNREYRVLLSEKLADLTRRLTEARAEGT